MVSVLTRYPDRARALWPEDPVECREADLSVPATLPAALRDINCIFHLASYAPAPQEMEIYEAPGHWAVTAEGTANLVDAALDARIRRLVYTSSVKVMGDPVAAAGKAVDEDVQPNPESLYGRAKLEAEKSILGAGASGEMHACILRLPMIYGLIGEGNIARMIAAMAKGRFPPWPRIENRRSAVHVEDAIGAALLAATHPRAQNKIYLVTDGASYSTRWLYERIRQALGREIPRWETPYWAIWSAAMAGTLLERLTGRRAPLDRDALRKLTSDAWFSCERIRAELGFEARRNLQDEIPLMVGEYLVGQRRPGELQRQLADSTNPPAT